MACIGFLCGCHKELRDCGIECPMFGCLKYYVFIPAWASPIIALIGLIGKKSDPTNPMNWSKVMICVAFPTGLAILVTADAPLEARKMGTYLAPSVLGYLVIDRILHSSK